MSTNQQAPDLLSCNAKWAEDYRWYWENANSLEAQSSPPPQTPCILWFGCSDSRVAETTICGVQPGDIFVHRNIANQFPTDDVNALAVLEFAVEFLNIPQIYVVGHTHCGGADACLRAVRKGAAIAPVASDPPLPPPLTPALNLWLNPLMRLASELSPKLEGQSETDALTILIETNVRQQIENIRQTHTIRNAQPGPEISGWIFDIETRKLRPLNAA